MGLFIVDGWSMDTNYTMGTWWAVKTKQKQDKCPLCAQWALNERMKFLIIQHLIICAAIRTF